MSGAWRRAAAAAAAAAALMAVASALTPSYDTNDDPLMALFAAGTVVAAQPDEHLVFSNVLIGRALAALHRRWPTAPWYGRYLLAVHALAAAGLVSAVLLAAPLRRRLALLALYLATVGLYFATHLQFTTAAFAAAQAGALLWLSSLPDPHAPARPRVAVEAGAVALLVLGSLVRLESFALALLLSVPAAVAWLVRLAPRQRARALAVPCLALAAAALAVAYDRLAYTGAWAEFRAFHDRLRAAEYSRYRPREERAPAGERVWSDNDRRLAARWFHVDGVLAERAHLAWSESADPGGGAERRPSGSLLRPLLREPVVWACLLLLLPALVWAGGPRGSGAALLGATLVLAVAVAAALAIAGRPPPPRVAVPLASFPLALALVLPGLAGGRWRVAGWLALAAGLAAAGGALAANVRHGAQARARNEAFRASVAALAAAPQALLVAWAARLPYESILPLERLDYLARLRVVPIGWPLRTPVVQGMLREFGAPDLTRALYEREDVLLVSGDALNRLYATYVREHHGLAVECRVHARLPSFVVYRVVRSAGGAAPGAATP